MKDRFIMNGALMQYQRTFFNGTRITRIDRFSRIHF